MANVFIALPAPAGNGVGAWVDVSAQGFEKTIVVGNLPSAVVNIEMSNEAAPTRPAPVTIFPDPGKSIVGCAALWMRARVSGYLGGGAPVIEIGANDDGATGASLPVTAGDGVGAAVDVHLLGLQKTVTVGGPFTGSVIIEASEDNVKWAPVWLLARPDQRSKSFAAKFMRVTRSGVGSPAGTPIVDVAAINDVAPGPGFNNPELVRYLANGTEGTSITVPITPRPNTAYFVGWLSQSEVAEQTAKAVSDIPRGTRALNQFVANLAADAAAGDEWEFLVVGG